MRKKLKWLFEKETLIPLITSVHRMSDMDYVVRKIRRGYLIGFLLGFAVSWILSLILAICVGLPSY